MLGLVSMERTVINGVHITARQVTVTLWREHVWAVFRVTRDQHAMNNVKTIHTASNVNEFVETVETGINVIT